MSRARSPSRWRRLAERVGDRLARSSQVFLAGLLVACLVEVAVDWNATLTEINVLRSQLRQKAENYVDIVRVAAESALLAYDTDELDRLSQRLLDDGDVVYVRYADALGNTLYDCLRPDYADEVKRMRGDSFRAHYRHVMERDVAGMLGDPAALKRRMAESRSHGTFRTHLERRRPSDSSRLSWRRHHDFIQAFTDAENRLFDSLSSHPTVAREAPPRTLYQDRLADAEHRLDRSLTYALGTVSGGDGNPIGVVLIAFRTDALQSAVDGKLWKGLGITLFFVGLIVVQNLSSRRARLRQIKLETALGAARSAIRGALPATPSPPWADFGIGFAQADSVGGTIYDVRSREDGAIDLLVAVPDGAGVDAAFASVVLRDVFRREGRPERALADEVHAVLRAYAASPLARRVEILLARFLPDGRVSGVVAGPLLPTVLHPASAAAGHPVVSVPAGEPLLIAEGVLHLALPLRPFAATLAPGDALALYSDGLPAGARCPWSAAEALAELAVHLAVDDAQALAEEAVARAVKQWRKRNTEDFFVLVSRWKGNG